MKIKDIVGLIKDPKLTIEILSDSGGESYGFYNRCVATELLNREVKEINVQYVNGERLLIIKF